VSIQSKASGLRDRRVAQIFNTLGMYCKPREMPLSSQSLRSIRRSTIIRGDRLAQFLVPANVT
jgi:hypothetical protein